MVKYPADSKDLMINIIGGIIVSMIVLAVEILNEHFPNHKICILWVGFFFLLFLFILSLGKYESLKKGQLKRPKK
jgi:hypothetical protein